MNVSIRNGPNFLGIGAPRSGTTWLYNMLKQHPQVWMPPIKELHYFDSIDSSTRFADVHRFSWRIRKQFARRAGHYAARPLGSVASRWQHKVDISPGFDRRYFTPGGSISWYRSLFDPAANNCRRVGEITPGYIVLSRSMIQRIRTETRVERVILLLRDPIEATWSGFGRMSMKGQTSISENDTAALLKGLSNPATLQRRLYAQNLGNWLSVFPREQVFIGFYEELSDAPGDLISRVSSFLDIEEPPSHVLRNAGQRIHSSRASRGAIPPAVESMLAKQVLDDLSHLVEMVGGPALFWLERAKSAALR